MIERASSAIISSTKTKQPLVVGINGIAGAGKDTISNMVLLSLRNDHGMQGQCFAFANNLKKAASLIFKRKMEDGNFEELWIYNVGNDIKRETQIRRAILAGTDVDPGSQESKDGSQRADTSTLGNVQFLHIVGLPQ